MDQSTRVLLACLAMRDGQAAPPELAQLPAPAWETVAEQADIHSVASLLYHRLRSAGPPVAIPVEAEQILAGITLYNTERNQRLRRQLAQVLNALQGAGIPAIVLKGNHLAELVYGDMALRLIGDIDLLLPQEALSRCGGAFQAIGYVPDHISNWQPEGYSPHYYPQAKGSPVDLHESLARPGDPFTVDVDGVWDRARPARIAGAGAWVLSPEDLIIHICLHASYQHLFLTGLRPFCDLAEIIRRHGDEIDWDQLRGRALQWGAGNCVYLTLLLTQRWLGASIPDEVWRGLAPAQMDDRVIGWAERRVFSTVGSHEDPWSDGLGTLRAARGFRGKLSAFLKVCFPPRRVMAETYALSPDAARIYLYYPLRMGHLLRRNLPRAWRLLRRDEKTAAWAEREEARTSLGQWLAPAR